jgi:hypothetical protein
MTVLAFPGCSVPAAAARAVVATWPLPEGSCRVAIGSGERWTVIGDYPPEVAAGEAMTQADYRSLRFVPLQHAPTGLPPIGGPPGRPVPRGVA